ncbi:MAG: hypothetical protein ABIT76_05910 [Chthoniobacterales bacterium]
MNWVGKVALGVFAAVVILGIFFPMVEDRPTFCAKPAAHNDVQQLTNALKAFYTEYGHYPEISRECVPSDGRLMSILKGEDHEQNPRKVVFIEVQEARKKSGRWINGIHPQTGAWLDPYGAPFWVKIDTDYNGIIPNPYSDAKAGPREINAGVIVWSAGKDGIFGNPNAHGQFQNSDDVLSWQ